MLNLKSINMHKNLKGMKKVQQILSTLKCEMEVIFGTNVHNIYVIKSRFVAKFKHEGK